ncbi:btk-binding protein-related [Anaeramoeba flamelloides]|uniref:Btk-binding protein-related n=1 Tax=Anaeramoeba flamelloides TaxID=1746091 RepID=A0AAV8AE99_9EUKA|nr:btk-binding protein-related [Anaeramoeba flamelloides]|eukprot:Anaeramoba_flamelloidesa326426_455.p1 GENE.a326426_455~~a326426_455.p1  ORF type:complete len:557 (-),score=137.33 a326426_455:172-1842(-)
MTEKSDEQIIRKINTTGNSVTNVQQPKGIQIIEAGYGNNFCVMIGSDGSVYEFNNQIQSMKKLNIKNGVKAGVGFSHYLVLTSDGMVYSRGSGTQLGLGSNTNATALTMIPTFQENNVKIVDLKAGVSHSYFLTGDGDYYACGSNTSKQLGLPDSKTYNVPTQLKGKKIKEIFCNNYAYGIWYKDEKDEVWGHGDHVVGRKKNYSGLSIFKDKQIIMAAPGYQKLLLLAKGIDEKTQEEKHYVYYETSNGEPTLWSDLTKEHVIDMDFGCHHCLMLTKDGRVLASSSMPTTYVPVKLPTIPKVMTWKIVCGAWDSVVFPVSDTNTLVLDMKEFQESGVFADLEILDKKVHSPILKWRTGKEGAQAIEVLKTFSEKHINSFLNWCYFGDLSNISLVTETAKAFDIEVDPKKSLEDHFLKLYYDEDSKDYEILVKDDEDDDDEEDEEEDEEDKDKNEEELIEVPVHKWILQARCGVYRDMFKIVKDEKNQIKDVSGLGPDSMEIFIKFLYTNTIELTADHIPEFVLPELEIVPEYYKLNEIDVFTPQLQELKKIKNIN